MFGGYPPTAIGYPPTAIGYPPTAIGYPPTAIGYPPAAIGYPPTAIGYPPAAIVGRIGHSEFFFFIMAPPAVRRWRCSLPTPTSAPSRTRRSSSSGRATSSTIARRSTKSSPPAPSGSGRRRLRSARHRCCWRTTGSYRCPCSGRYAADGARGASDGTKGGRTAGAEACSQAREACASTPPLLSSDTCPGHPHNPYDNAGACPRALCSTASLSSRPPGPRYVACTHSPCAVPFVPVLIRV